MANRVRFQRFIESHLLVVIVAAWIVIGFPSPLWAEKFTGAQFLEWPKINQTSYLHTSIGMAGLIARQNSSPQGDCIDKWFFQNQSAAYNSVMSVMRQYKTYHPAGIILAVIEKKCGKLVYLKK